MSCLLKTVLMIPLLLILSQLALGKEIVQNGMNIFCTFFGGYYGLGNHENDMCNVHVLDFLPTSTDFYWLLLNSNDFLLILY